MTIEKYLDPKNDVVFKKIFGSEKNKDILIHFLNDMLRGDNEVKIIDVKFLSPIQDPKTKYQKQSIVDVLCTDEAGVIFIVEMQVAKVGGFEKRAQYYAAKAYSSQMEKGKAYASLKEIVFLAITDYVMFPNKGHYKSDHVILDKISYEHDLKDFSFTFIELPKFKKEKVEELISYEEKWCYFFKHSDNPKDMRKLIKNSDEVIHKAYEAMSVHNFNERELEEYEAVMKSRLDMQAREELVRDEGIAEGIEKGLEKGIKKGKAEAMKETVKRMLSRNRSIEVMVEDTGLSLEEILTIKKSMENNN